MIEPDVLDYESAARLVADLAARRTSAVELVDRAIARIERYDGALNAVVVRDFERARAAAAGADAALARGERRPLLGLPITVKESYNVAGLPTTWGMPWFAGWRAPEDAVTVARLKAAGAIVLGKTNVPFALGDWQSFNKIYGSTGNPWALDRTPGGSSGGSAASLAAGYVALEMGSDIGGSLRAPAHYCGVYSHKPSRGVIPPRGHVPPGTFGSTADLAVVGPLARSAADLELAFDVLAGPDILEATGFRLALPPPRHERLSDYRVFVLDSHPLLPADAAVRGALGRVAERLRAAGARVETSSELLPDLDELARAFVGLLMPVVFARHPEERYRALAAQAAALPAEADTVGAWTVRASVSSHRDWLAADAKRLRTAYQWHDFFRTYDVVLFPPMPTPAYERDESDDLSEATIEIDGTAYPYGDQVLYASLATAAGLPATTAPLERSASGLPVGVQIIGPFLEDRTTLRFAALLEQAYGGFVPPPAFSTAR
jgi:amidase